MALRLAEAFVPVDVNQEPEEILRGATSSPGYVSSEPLQRQVVVVRAVVGSSRTGPLMDALHDRFASAPGFRVLMLPLDRAPAAFFAISIPIAHAPLENLSQGNRACCGAVFSRSNRRDSLASPLRRSGENDARGTHPIRPDLARTLTARDLVAPQLQARRRQGQRRAHTSRDRGQKRLSESTWEGRLRGEPARRATESPVGPSATSTRAAVKQRQTSV